MKTKKKNLDKKLFFFQTLCLRRIPSLLGRPLAGAFLSLGRPFAGRPFTEFALRWGFHSPDLPFLGVVPSSGLPFIGSSLRLFASSPDAPSAGCPSPGARFRPSSISSSLPRVFRPLVAPFHRAPFPVYTLPRSFPSFVEPSFPWDRVQSLPLTGRSPSFPWDRVHSSPLTSRSPSFWCFFAPSSTCCLPPPGLTYDSMTLG